MYDVVSVVKKVKLVIYFFYFFKLILAPIKYELF